MERLIVSIFKAIATTLIAMFIFEIVFYLYRVFTLTERVESMAVQLQKIVMENNYLPEESADVYEQLIFKNICDYNRVSYNSSSVNNLNNCGVNKEDAFVIDFNWNYGSDIAIDSAKIPEVTATRYYKNNTGSLVQKSVDIVSKDMSEPASYGDMQIIYLSFEVAMPMVKLGATVADAGRIERFHTTTLDFVYYVPCLKYQTFEEY